MEETQQLDPNTPTLNYPLQRTRKPTINGRLPPDSLLQIWARIPIKSLYKFRSVCKLWNIQIASDPLLSDLRRFLSPPPQPPNLLLFLRHVPPEPVRVPDRPVSVSTGPFEDIIKQGKEPSTFRVKNGFTPYVDYSIQLLPSKKGPIVCFVSEKYFYLCNPSIQEFFRVSPGQNGNFTSNAAFGYLEEMNKYVIAGLAGEECAFFEFGPGQAGSSSWREIKQKCPVQPKRFGLMVNRVFYWTGGGEPDSFAVGLDVEQEEFRVIPPPVGNENEDILYDMLYLIEFKGCLCAVDNFSRSQRMQVWVLNEMEGEYNWVRKFNIFISGMDKDIVYPFCDYEGENGGEIVLCNEKISKLYCYNVKSRSIKKVYWPKHRTSDRLALYTPGIFPLSIAS